MRLRIAPLLVVVAASGACLELPPHVIPVDAGAEMDTGPKVPPDAGPSACVKCLMAPEDPGPGCGSHWDACQGEPKCTGLLECTDETGCFQISSLSDFLVCVDPCVKKYMLMGTTDPVYPIVTQIVLCTTGAGACVPICSAIEARPN
jgi:hypothetical protein